MKIQADYREKNSLVCSELVELGSECEYTHLQVADFIIGGVAVERKTVSDFISSMINKRLLRQLEELQQFDKRLLIIEGIEEQELYNDEPEGMNGNAIRGMLLSIALEFKCPTIFTKDYNDTARFLHLIKKRQEKSPSPVSLQAKKRNLSFKEQKQFIIESFPNVGPVKAKQLLKKFRTISNIVNAGDEELEEILKSRASHFRKLLDN
jgi:Fanconi anemia group M protein